MDTKAVVEHHLDALRASSLEETLADYTDASVLITGGTVAQGLDALRAIFVSALETLFKPGAFVFTLDSLVVHGEYALITWRLRFDGGEITFGTDTFHVRDGKIVMQTGAVQMA
jgi:ketosteroid isomerase-like protein